MKKALKWLGIVVGIIIIIIIAAGVVIMLVVNEKMVAGQMEKALNRHVTIEKLNAGIFAVASGIEVSNVRISNYKTQNELAALKDKPVPENDLFVGLKAFNFKIKILPLFKGKAVLDELVLYEPKINVIKFKNGAYNFSDLLKSGKKEEKKEPEKESKPFKADDLPVEINVGKIGLEKGLLSYIDQGLGQTVQVYNLTALVHSIKIDPKDLNNNDSVGVKIKMGIKTIGDVKSGAVKSFDLGFDATGSVIPFDKKTRILNPEIDLKAGLPYGMITGLQIFEKVKSVEALAKYSGKLDFLQKDIKWKNAFVSIWYKDNVAKLKQGKINTEDFALDYEGMTNINTKAVDLNMNMLLADKYKQTIRSGIEKNIKKAITGKTAKYIKPETITDTAMKSITDEDGKVFLKYEVGGKLNSPDVRLVSPKLPSVNELVKNSSGDIKEAVKEQAKEEAQKATEKAAEKATNKLKKKFKLK